jgi:hypothetical protein
VALVGVVDLGTLNLYVFGAFFIASVGAAYRVQWQSAFYLWTCSYVSNLNGFILVTAFYMAAVLFARTFSAASAK